MEKSVMRLLEYECKQLFKEFGIPTLNSIVISKEDSVMEKLEGIQFPVVVKAQVPIGSRKKRGLIKDAADADECVSIIQALFTSGYEDIDINEILVEEFASVQKEFYASIALDTFNRQFLFIASGEGGIDIENVSRENPDAIIKEPIAIFDGIAKETLDQIAERMEIPSEFHKTAIEIFQNLWKITMELEAELVEINPLAITDSGLVALDGKMIVDDNAAFRQPIISDLEQRKNSKLEKIAAENSFSFVKMDGDIGVLANGAGLTLALLDILSNYGLNPANFLDVGGGASAERVKKALDLIFKLNPRGVLINIFGGITRCDVVAQGIIQALENFERIPPLAIRLSGTNENEGNEILNGAGLNVFHAFLEAVEFLQHELQTQGGEV